MKWDRVYGQILQKLQENCRITLTELAKEVGLSVDSVKKRMDKLITNKAFYPKVQIRPRAFGYDNVVEVKIKLHNYSKENYHSFITHCIKLPKVIDVIEISGEYHFTITFIAKDSIDIGTTREEIRSNYGHIIDKWSESLTTKVYKYGQFNMEKLLGLEHE